MNFIFISIVHSNTKLFFGIYNFYEWLLDAPTS